MSTNPNHLICDHAATCPNATWCGHGKPHPPWSEWCGFSGIICCSYRDDVAVEVRCIPMTKENETNDDNA